MARNDPAVGIAISDTTLRSLALDPATLKPIAAAETPISGTLAASLRESVRSLRVRPSRAVTAFGLDRATVRRITLPQTSQPNVDRMVRFEAERYIPFPMDAVELDYYAEPDRAADRLDVVVAAVRKDEATQLSAALADATSADTAIDTTATALLAAWSHARGDVSEAVLLVDLSGESASLVVCESGNLVLARSVPTGADALRRAISEDLKISLQEAEQVRADSGVTGLEAGPSALAATDENPDREHTGAWLQGLGQEVRRTLESFRSQRGGMQRCGVDVTGDGAETPGLREALADALGMSVGVFDPLGDDLPELAGRGHAYAIAYGLALRAAGRAPVQIDLSPKAERAASRRRERATGAVAAVTVGAIALLAVWWFANDRLTRLEKRADGVATELERLSANVGDLDAALAEAAAVSDMQDVLAALDETSSRPLDVMHGITVSLPQGVWFDDFLYDQSRGVSIHGKAIDAESITAAVGVLSRKPYLFDVKVSSISISTIGKTQVYEFDITGDFAEPEEGQRTPGSRTRT